MIVPLVRQSNVYSSTLAFSNILNWHPIFDVIEIFIVSSQPDSVGRGEKVRFRTLTRTGRATENLIRREIVTAVFVAFRLEALHFEPRGERLGH
jgi:hypothetical protein